MIQIWFSKLAGCQPALSAHPPPHNTLSLALSLRRVHGSHPLLISEFPPLLGSPLSLQTSSKALSLSIESFLSSCLSLCPRPTVGWCVSGLVAVLSLADLGLLLPLLSVTWWKEHGLQEVVYRALNPD